MRVDDQSEDVRLFLPRFNDSLFSLFFFFPLSFCLSFIVLGYPESRI